MVLALATWRLFAPAWRPRLRVAAVALGLLLAVGPLTGAASDLAATAARYPEVLGGPAEHRPAGN